MSWLGFRVDLRGLNLVIFYFEIKLEAAKRIIGSANGLFGDLTIQDQGKYGCLKR